MLNRLFALAEHQTTVRTEVLAGLTTFITMAYIIFVQPAVLTGAITGRPTGMDFGAVTAATCLSAALASVIMGLYARYPVAQAPGMGQNFFFVLGAVPAATAAGFANAWEVALGVVFISGVLFLLLSFFGVREAVLDAISPSLKHAIAVGIGLFIAFIGLRNAGLIVMPQSPGAEIHLNPHLASPDLLVFFFGLLLAAALHTRRVAGSILWGIAGATALAIALKLSLPLWPASWAESPLVQDSMLVKRFSLATGLVSLPPSLAPTFLKLDLRHALSFAMAPFIIVFLFMVLFDTVGTLIGVAEQAGFIKNNQLPRAKQAFASDALATTLGACLGTSTVTSYIESAAGVEQGGRTGLTAVVAGAFFLLALFFTPVIAMVGSYAPITAPALVLVGAMMIRNVARIDWSDYSESIPAFLIMVGIPLSYSIGDGLAVGFLSYPLLKLLAGRGREVKWVLYALGVLLLAYFVFVRGKMG
ncbi:MAG: NCS2 family permease [Verrucomicrobia bacterium]|nr:NCS2 family permease [Verrucomicrobiota bacterium]